MRAALAILAGLSAAGIGFAVHPLHLMAQSSAPSNDCGLLDRSDPRRLGDHVYAGAADHHFKYWSDAAGKPGAFEFQHGVQNLGAKALSFEWMSAEFARADVRPKALITSECRTDGNPPNVPSGVIRYGPNSNFAGPDAQFYQYQRFQISRQEFANVGESRTASVRWTALTPTGDDLAIDLRVVSSRVSETQVQYDVINDGAVVLLEWPGVLTDDVRKLAIQQNQTSAGAAGLELRGPSLMVPSKRAFKALVTSRGTVNRVASPLTIRAVDMEQRVLYRDVFTGIATSTTQLFTATAAPALIGAP